MSIVKLAEQVEFNISTARCRLGVEKEQINKIEREVYDFMLAKKQEIASLEAVCEIKKEK